MEDSAPSKVDTVSQEDAFPPNRPKHWLICSPFIHTIIPYRPVVVGHQELLHIANNRPQTAICILLFTMKFQDNLFSYIQREDEKKKRTSSFHSDLPSPSYIYTSCDHFRYLPGSARPKAIPFSFICSTPSDPAQARDFEGERTG